jgi:hypothetical protein
MVCTFVGVAKVIVKNWLWLGGVPVGITNGMLVVGLKSQADAEEHVGAGWKFPTRSLPSVARFVEVIATGVAVVVVNNLISDTYPVQVHAPAYSPAEIFMFIKDLMTMS